MASYDTNPMGEGGEPTTFSDAWSKWLAWLARQQASLGGQQTFLGGPQATPPSLITGVQADQQADNPPGGAPGINQSGPGKAGQVNGVLQRPSPPSSLISGVYADQNADNPPKSPADLADADFGVGKMPISPAPAPASPPPGDSGPQGGDAMPNNQNPGFRQLPGEPVAGTPGAPADPPKTGMDRTRSIYQQRANDNPQTWARRVMEMSGQDYGRADLNPNSAVNPFANSPYAAWIQQQYGNAAPFDALLHMLISADGGGAEPTSAVEGYMRDFQQGGGLHQAGDLGQTRGNLDQLQALIDRFIQDPSESNGMTPGQRNAVSNMTTSPQLAQAILLSQLQNMTGGYGGNALAGQVGDLANTYYNDPVNQNPAQMGTFFARARKLAGL